MSKALRSLTAAAVLMTTTAAAAQAPAPLSPAPVLSTERDQWGRPVPFGVPPYRPPETPLGSGPFKAIMATEPTLTEHVVYYPADIAAAGRLPIIVWGNGGCIHAGNRFRAFLTEIASHGFLVISAGTMGHVSLEVGPQENPTIVPPFTAPRPPAPPAPAAAPPANDPSAPWRAERSTAEHMRQAVDWAVAENMRPGSKFFGRLDTNRIAAAGQSCGGGLAVQTAAADPRVSVVGIFNSSSTRLTPAPGNPDPLEFTRQARARIDAVRGPILYITGDAARDTGYPFGHEVFNYATRQPVFHAWQEGLGHIASYGAPNGGNVGRIASAWFAWQLRGDPQAARMFSGWDCTLCHEPTWHVQKKHMP